MQLCHGPGVVPIQQQGQGIQGGVDAGIDQLALLCAGLAEDMTGDPRGVAGVANADPQAGKVPAVAEGWNDIPQAVVAAMPTAALEAGCAWGQVELIVGDQNLLGWNAEKARHGGNRLAAAIHEGGGNEQAQIVPVAVQARSEAVKA